ncbi:unannotated protein [freshwater metagenome]|uniref:Unannotated protein n=1 Tax=freshwater metagenome TaxID=449393 RepID=A0A6J6MBK0_9ZZZZ
MQIYNLDASWRGINKSLNDRICVGGVWHQKEIFGAVSIHNEVINNASTVIAHQGVLRLSIANAIEVVGKTAIEKFACTGAYYAGFA